MTEPSAPENVVEQEQARFSERELADLVLAVIAITGANRMNIALSQIPPTTFTISATFITLNIEGFGERSISRSIWP